MKTFIKLIGIFLVSIFIAGAIYAKLGTENNSKSPDPKNIIIGTWKGIKPEGTVWKYNDDGTMEKDGDAGKYKLVTGATHSECQATGYDAIYNSDQLVLIQTVYDIKKCYMVDFLGYHQETGKTRMTLFYEPAGQYLSFIKE